MRYLIDGYNLAHALGLVHGKGAGHGAEVARRSLLIRLRKAPGLDPAQTTVVFDALRAPKRAPSRQDLLGFRIFFAHDQLADDLIEDMVRREPFPAKLTVVSDDRRLKESAGRRGCGWLGCLDFLEAIQRPAAPAPADAPPAEESDKPERMTTEELREWQRTFGVDPDAVVEDDW